MTEQAKPAGSATFTLGDASVELPVLAGSTGPDVVDIRKLYGATGAFTFDPGFTSTASCESKITYIDGDAGVLLYRGYPIEQLAEKSNFLEVAYLLMNGELPTAGEFSKFEHEVTHHTMMHEAFRTFLYGFRHDAYPMAMLVGMLGSMASFYHNELDLEDPEQRRLAAIRLIAKVPTIAAACHRYSIGWPIRYPKNSLDYTTRFLHMLFEVPSEPLEINPVVAKALDLLFILHADHEQNCSTNAVRSVGSSQVDPYSAVAAGVGALFDFLAGEVPRAPTRWLDMPDSDCFVFADDGGLVEFHADLGDMVKKGAPIARLWPTGRPVMSGM